MPFSILSTKVKKLSLFFFICSVFFLNFPNKTSAGGVVWDPGNNIPNVASAFADNAITIKEYGLDTAAYLFVNIIIKRMTAQTVNWINSGFKGNPAYITDPGQFFLETSDRVASTFLSSTALNQLCSPFKAEVRLALVRSYLDDYRENYSCSLSKIKDNYEAFMNDFSQGGWEGWFELTQIDSNNPYGSYLQAKNSLSVQIGSQQKKYQDQLQWGSGFLSFEKCASPLTQIDIDNGYGEQGYAVGDCFDNNYVTVTPGSVIQNQLDNTLSSGMRRIEVGDEINEIVGSLLTQLTLKSIQGLKNITQGSNGGNSFIDQLANEVDSKNTNTDKYVTCDSAGNCDVVKQPPTPAPSFSGGTVNCTTDDYGNMTCTIPPSGGDTGGTPPPSGGGGTSGPGTPVSEPSSLISQVSAVRAQYGATLTSAELAQLLTTAASGNSGWGLLRKTSGETCPSANGPVSCDILFHSPSCLIYDVLVNSDANVGPAIPAWQFAGGNVDRSLWVDVGSGGAGSGPCTQIIGGGGGSGGGGTGGGAPTSLLSDLQAERSKYPASLSNLCTNPSGLEPAGCPLGFILNTVAWNNRSAGWGLSQKTSGHRCHSPAGEIACDILGYQPTNTIYDVFRDSENVAEPIWGSGGSAPRPWVAPAQP